jgi:putative SOS response-associated peptidase YedK
MCYNVSYIEKRAERVSKHYGIPFSEQMPALTLFHVSGFAHPQLPVITTEEPYHIQAYQWGLIPSWTKDAAQAKQIKVQTLNAKAETLFEKPAFRSSINKRRCVVIVNGFYEWHTSGKNKYPHYVRLKDQDFFSLGGIYETWVDRQTAEIFNTFSIITVDANPLMAKIHNTKQRMPFILPVEDEMKWIDPNLSKESILELLKPISDDKMETWSISKRITDRKQDNNVAEVMEPFIYPELSLLL